MTNKELAKVVGELTEKVNALSEIVASMIEKPPKVEEPKTIQSTLPPEKVNGLPIPGKWRAKIDEVLGKSFEAEAEDSSGGDFLLKIYMPEQLDRRPKGERQGRDTSIAVIHRATDVADVETWSKRIKENILKNFPNTLLPL